MLQCLPEAAALEAYYTPEARLREVVGREHQALRLDAVQELAAGPLSMRMVHVVDHAPVRVLDLGRVADRVPGRKWPARP